MDPNISPQPVLRGNGLYICTNCKHEIRITWGGKMPDCWLCNEPLKKKDDTTNE
jgi:hypothetical protein